MVTIREHSMVSRFRPMLWTIVAFALPGGSLIAEQMQVGFTHSRHPDLTDPLDMQKLFDDGAALLLSDDDGSGSGGDDDDVSLDVKFTISDAAAATFPDGFASPEFLDLTNDFHVLHLLDADFACIKQVRSAFFRGNSSKSNGTMIIVATGEIFSSTGVHEWGHLAGLYHRDPVDNIMRSPAHTLRKEINVHERGQLKIFHSKCK